LGFDHFGPCLGYGNEQCLQRGNLEVSLNYDVVVNDLDGTDVLMGAGANRSNTATEQVLMSSLGFVANDTLEIQVSNAGNTKQGTAYIYIR
jgi:hypothetical protein